MGALLGPPGSAALPPGHWAGPETLAVPGPEGTPVPQRSPLVLGDVVGRTVIRLVGAIPLERSDEWATQRSRHMTPETIGPFSDTAAVSLPAVAAWPDGPAAKDHRSYTTRCGTTHTHPHVAVGAKLPRFY